MARDPEAVKRAKRNYLLRHPDRRKATVKKYYEAHRDEERARLIAWQQEHPERYAEWRRTYKRQRYAEGLETPIEWQKKHPEKVRVYKQNTKAKRRAVSGVVSHVRITQLMALQHARCAICQKSLTKYHVDHIQPIAKGGTNDDENLQLLCAPCNQSKSSRDPIEYMRSRGKLL